jgi:hypothetical protein
MTDDPNAPKATLPTASDPSDPGPVPDEDTAPARRAVGTPELESIIDQVVELTDAELDHVHAALEGELYKRRTAPPA